MYPDPAQQRRLLPLKEVITKGFDKQNWLEPDAMTGYIG